MNDFNYLPRRRKALAVGLGLALGISAAAQAGATEPSPRHEFQAATTIPAGLELKPSTIDASSDLAAFARSATPGAQTAPTVTTATIPVTNCDDTGAGSLRAAIQSASSGDTIDMSGLSCSIITTDSFFSINQDDLTLQGDGGLPWIDSTSSAGLIHHNGSGLLTIDGLTIRGGTKYGGGTGPNKYGGCIASSGSVSLIESTVKYCEVERTGANTIARGGAIYAAGDVTLMDSDVRGSTVTGTQTAQGGGIFAGGTLTTKYSTIDGNSATATAGNSQAGGVWASGMNIKYSTISNNTAEVVGGLLSTTGPNDSVSLKSSTISGNHATGASASAGAWFNSGSSVSLISNTITDNVNETSQHVGGLHIADASSIEMTNNIISGNLGIFDPLGLVSYDFELGVNVTVTVTGSDNLIGWVDTRVISPNLPDDTIKEYDTPLGPLQNNGGRTSTHMPAKGSWAFNMGSTTTSIDQREETREVGAGVDIGSTETDSLFVGRFEEPNLHGL